MANSRPDLEVALLPMVLELHKRSPAQVKAVHLRSEVEHQTATRYLFLDVRHVIRAAGWDAPWSPVDFSKMEKRIRTALLIQEPSVKSRRVERRLMLARGEQARKSKARRAPC